MNAILFYAVDKPYGSFSNFARYPIEARGVTWPTSEHYFQAAKMVRQSDQDDVRNAKTAFLAAQLGRDRTRPIRDDWDAIKDQVMLEALQFKFDQHESLKDVLISTSGARLVEHTSNDSYWADGGDGTGRNRLGELLARLRDTYPCKFGTLLVPPWVKYPDVEVSDFFWRMGRGEDYLIQSSRWRQGLPDAARREFDSYFHVTPEWLHSW